MMVAAIAGTALKVVGAKKQADAEADAQEWNAQLADNNAAAIRDQANADMQAQQRSAARSIGDAVASYGASGLKMTEGSAADQIASSIRESVLDRETIRYNAELKATGLNTQANLNRWGANQSRNLGYIMMASEALNGMGKGMGGGAFGGGGGK